MASAVGNEAAHLMPTWNLHQLLISWKPSKGPLVVIAGDSGVDFFEYIKNHILALISAIGARLMRIDTGLDVSS